MSYSIKYNGSYPGSYGGSYWSGTSTFNGGLFTNGGFDGTLVPWVSAPIDQFDLSADGDNAESFDVAGVGGAELTQDIALVAGNSYTMSGVNIADSGVSALWYFEGVVQTGSIFDTPATFVATATGTFPCGIHTPEGCGLSFDNMRMVLVVSNVVTHNGEVVTHNGEEVIHNG